MDLPLPLSTQADVGIELAPMWPPYDAAIDSSIKPEHESLEMPLIEGATKSTWKSSPRNLVHSHYERVEALHKNKISKATDIVLTTLKLAMALSPLLFTKREALIALFIGIILSPLLVYGTTQGIAHLHAMRLHPITKEMSEEEVTAKRETRALTVQTTGTNIRRVLDVAFNPIGNLAAGFALKGIETFQEKYTEEGTRAHQTLQVSKVIAYHGLRMLAPTTFYAIAAIVHNMINSPGSTNPIPISREMELRAPYSVSPTPCTQVMTWERAPAARHPSTTSLANPQTITYNYHQMIASAAAFGISPERMRESVQSSLERWADHTSLSFTGSEVPCDSDCGQFEINFIVDSTIGVAAQTNGPTIWVNPNPNIGPRWTDSIQMLINTLAHEFGHTRGLEHYLEHYSIMHEGPRWEPGITAPDLPEWDIAKMEELIGKTPGRLPGLDPHQTSLCTDFSYLLWRISQEFSPYKIT